MHVEHQFAHFGEAPQAAGRDMPAVQFVDLAVVEEGDLVEGFGHELSIRR